MSSSTPVEKVIVFWKPLIRKIPQVITSPSYPSNYPNSVRCRWTFVTDRLDKIRIRFTDFDVEAFTGCGRDKLTIADVNLSVGS
jgi:hypothetical protein